MDKLDRFSGYYAAWFTPTGESLFKKPQKLYYDDWSQGRNLWHKGGNHDIEKRYWDGGEGWHFATPAGSKLPRFVSRDPEKVKAAIDAAKIVRESIHAAFGFDS